MKLPPAHYLAAGGALFLGAGYTTYRYATVHREAAEATQGDGCSSCTFSALADKYDDAIGAEETWMGLGILRW